MSSRCPKHCSGQFNGSTTLDRVSIRMRYPAVPLIAPQGTDAASYSSTLRGKRLEPLLPSSPLQHLPPLNGKQIT
jgi:hypothetical protein